MKRPPRRPNPACGGRPGTCLGPLRFLAALCVFLLLPERALPHAVYIFAWVDGPRLCTQSYFSKSSRVMGGEVRMADTRGTVLDSGRSDEEGLLCFAPPPEARDIVFTVNAGLGHRGEYLLPAAEVELAVAARQREEQQEDQRKKQREERQDGLFGAPSAASGIDGVARPTPSPGSAGSGTGNATRPASSPGSAASGLDSAARSPSSFSPPDSAGSEGQALSPAARSEVLAMIRQETSPLRQALAEQKNDSSPRLRDILGGLAWIFGLAAVAALYYNRGKRN